ncbi:MULTISPECIES: YqaE/Pmp3 family membrane protein [unclassified Microcoleus]|uniref:YqaE/Pmp3 family membrane protein n=1 Tax=unclassified Microcoleus TaxID=2642155 RepID=UPI002FD31F00
MSDHDFENDYKIAEQRYKQMASEADDLRYEALKNLNNENYLGAIDNCQEYLKIIDSLPRIAVELYCKVSCKMYSGDLVIYTASIFKILYLAYFCCDDTRVLESWVCLQKLNQIITKYRLVEPKKAKNWLEYKALLEAIRRMYFELQSDLKKYTRELQECNFINDSLEIKEEIVLAKHPNVDRENLSYLKNYYPLLFKKKLDENPEDGKKFLRIVAAIWFPLVGVFLTVGFGLHLWINLALMVFLGSLNVASNPLALLGACILLIIHALWVVFNED